MSNDRKQWLADHYGRHDVEHIGLLYAIRCPVPFFMADDRIPNGMGGLPSELLGGKHRQDVGCAHNGSVYFSPLFNCFRRVTAQGTYVVVGSHDAL